MHTEQTIWVQTQAPAGNWCDRTGFPFGPDVSRTEATAIEDARRSATYEKANYSKQVRIIKRYFEIIE